MKRLLPAGVGVCLLLILAASTTAQEAERWEFTSVTRITIDGLSGDVILLAAEGPTGAVELRERVTPAGAFRGEVEQSGGNLRINEHWEGRNTSGSVEWRIYLPPGGTAPNIVIDTASGDLDADGVNATIRFDTASGDVNLRSVTLGDDSRFDTASGDIELTDVRIGAGTDFDTASGDVILSSVTVPPGTGFSTASGDVRAANCRGELNLDTASGDVRIRNCELTGLAKFSSASGDVEIDLPNLPAGGIEASSASGDVSLSIARFGENYRLVLIKRQDRGRISCPFEFTEETTFEEGRYTYERKVVHRGSGQPLVELRTASGSVVVRGR